MTRRGYRRWWFLAYVSTARPLMVQGEPDATARAIDRYELGERVFAEVRRHA